MTVGDLKIALSKVKEDAQIVTATAGGIVSNQQDTFWLDPSTNQLIIHDGAAFYEEEKSGAWLVLKLDTLEFVRVGK